MIDFLAGILEPIFTPMGVSSADLLGYLQLCSPYVYAAVIALGLMLVAMVAAIFVKKGKKHLVRWNALLAFLLAVVVIANLVCYGPMKSTVSTFLNGSGIELSEETIAASKDVIKEVGEEGLVLVKNNGLLPLSSDTKALNVFGWDSTNPLFGGTGSGSSDGSSAVGILQSLKDAGYSTNEELTQMYLDYCSVRPTIAMANQDWTLPEPTKDKYTAELMGNAASFSDTAVIVIGRSGGEGADLPTDMYSVIHGTYNLTEQGVIVQGSDGNFHYGYTNATYTNNGDYDDFDQGESYLELSNTEEDMIETVCSQFDKVIVVINANNTMELGWVDEYDSIGAVILAPGTGNTGMAALGEIINGSVNPSGRTVDTFVKDLNKTPYINNIGNHSFTNVDDLKNALTIDAAYEGNLGFVNYVEGIYVGYRFYETAAEEGLINYDEMVQYPFGYGLSYTTFKQEITSFDASGDAVKMEVTVTNTGNAAGKDVVEVYYNPPYTNGGIEKASVNLVQFDKTGLLKAGESEVISFTIPKEDMASYDSDGIKINGGGYILEAGTYELSIRSDSHTVLDTETFEIAADIDYSKDGRDSDKVVAVNQFQEYSAGTFEQLSRADGFANYETATAAPAEDAYEMDAATLEAVKTHSVVGYDGTKFDDPSDAMPTMGAGNAITLADLRGAAYDDAKWETLLDNLSFDDMVTMITFGGWSTAAVESVGKMATSDCDGPAGLSNFMTGAYGTAYPSEVLMAQTWNTELMEKMGECLGQEYSDANNFGWYGPAMNTHRSAFAGRNFEYYSEDGVLAGYMAAAEINGAQKKGVYAYIKHFAVNDQETNRCAFLLTYAREQAIRELYLKPFELTVKNYQGTGLAAMSAFNWIGTVPCCVNGNLLNNVLRDEWGFVGFVETDYDGSYGYMITDGCVRNGGNLMLGFGNASNPAGPNALPFGGAAQSATLVNGMRQSCKNIMYTIVNSGYYADGSGDSGMSPMNKLFLTIDIAAVLAALLVETILLVRYNNKKKRAKVEK